MFALSFYPEPRKKEASKQRRGRVLECLWHSPFGMLSGFASAQRVLSFAEIVQGRDALVRVTDDGHFDVVDTVMVVTGKDCNQSNETLRSLRPSLFDKEKFFMRNGRRYASKQDIIALIMILPGKIAKEIRAQFAKIIEEYVSLHHDASTGNTTVQLRSDLVEDHEARRKRIKREELEMFKLEQDIKRGEEEIQEMRSSTQERRIRNMGSFMNLMSTIRPDWMQTDQRFRLQTEDMIKNIITTGAAPASQQLITSGSVPEPIGQPASLSISQLARELGCKALTHADACSAGKLAAKRYRALHGVDPPKHRQWVDGAERVVNSYTEGDRGLLVAVLTDIGLSVHDGE